MDWNLIFTAANTLTLLAWIVLILLPWRDRTVPLLREFMVLALSATYAILIILLFTVFPSNSETDFNTIEGVRAIFSTDGGTTIGWIHYLAFDLFVGLWIAKDADARGFSRILQAPILVFTFMLGPVGLTLWLIIRRFLRDPATEVAS